jgi:hypothetical protein
VRVLVDDRANPNPNPNPNPNAERPAATPPVDPPKDAKVVLSVESLIGADGGIYAKCVIGGQTIRLKGRVTAMQDGKRRVSIDFSQRADADGRQVSTNVILAPDEQRIIGVLTGSNGARLVAVRIKADDGPAAGKAE